MLPLQSDESVIRDLSWLLEFTPFSCFDAEVPALQLDKMECLSHLLYFGLNKNLLNKTK